MRIAFSYSDEIFLVKSPDNLFVLQAVEGTTTDEVEGAAEVGDSTKLPHIQDFNKKIAMGIILWEDNPISIRDSRLFLSFYS